MIRDQSGATSTEWLELPNGCVCCSVRGDLVRTIEYLAERQNSFDYIFLETDGLVRHLKPYRLRTHPPDVLLTRINVIGEPRARGIGVLDR